MQTVEAENLGGFKKAIKGGAFIPFSKMDLFNDGGEMVGHDWIVINDNGSEIIFDAAAEQFDTEPFADKYTEVWAARQPKRENKAMKITESKLRLLVREEISKILKEVGRDPLGRMDEPTPRINPRAQKMLYDLIKHEEQALKSKDLDAVKKYGRLIARVLRDIGEFDDAPNYLKEGKIEKIPDPEEVSVGAEIENLPYSGSEIDDPDADEWQGDPGKRPSFNKEYWEKDKKLFNQAIQKILNQDDQHLVDMGFTPKEIQRLRARHVEGLFAGDFDMAQMAYGKMEPEEPYGGDSNLVEKKKKARS
tara:strand:- start:1039 stop:1956 length:918 start_codon:yes stop_codon:yes gene_type:complete